MAALYVVLCMALQPLSYGAVQVRVAEALCLLPVFGAEYIAGVVLGCFLANLLGSTIVDVILGTLATLLACVVTYKLRNVRIGGLAIPAALEHYRELGLEFDCIYTGYLGGEAQTAIAEKAFDLWPAAKKVVDPVMGDNGKAYSTVTPEFIDRMRTLCQRADLILPNVTEAGLLLRKEMFPENFDEAGAQALADELTTLAPDAIVTGVAMGKYIGCAGAGRDRFVIKKLHIERSFPGTGDLYGAVLIGSLIQGNVMSAAADNAAEFVSLAIQKTPADQDTRFGVWFEPLLPRLCPLREL